GIASPGLADRRIDTTPLAAYCASYSRWRTAEEHADRRQRLSDARSSGEIYGRQRASESPYQSRCRCRCGHDRYAGEFGLMPVARARLAGGVRPPGPNKFDGFWAETNSHHRVTRVRGANWSRRDLYAISFVAQVTLEWWLKELVGF